MKKACCIVLIGMPGSGKSTVGKALAKKLGWDFLDTDRLIESREGARLERIIHREGVDRFLEIEGEVCCAVDAVRTVVATGGSVVYREEAMRRLEALGTIVYLQVSLNELEQRLGDLRARGVALRDGQTLRELYAERTALYERWAAIVIPSDTLSVEHTAELIAEKVFAP